MKFSIGNLLAVQLFVLLSGAGAFAQDFTWKAVPMDGSRTGVVPTSAYNVEEALGSVDGRRYYAPNGRVFKDRNIVRTAEELIVAQPGMSDLKTVIGHSAEAMHRKAPECALSDWFVDNLMKRVETLAGKKIDVGIANFGGIRVDMPEGEVIMDDIMSMFPFKNQLCYVAVKGSDLRYLLEQMAKKKIQVLGGVRIVVTDNQLTSALVGGEPIDDDKTYGIATISFLLNGGDNISVARNALEVKIFDEIPMDTFLALVKDLESRGEKISYQKDGRIQVIRTVPQKEMREIWPEGDLSKLDAVGADAHKRLTIMHFNDTHSHMEPVRSGEGNGLGGVIEQSVYIDSVRRVDKKCRTLLLHAGDFSQGTSYFTRYNGNIEVQMLNRMGFDVVTLGNHEFDNGTEDLARRLKTLKMPVVCANYDFSQIELGKYVKPYTIIRRGGLKIGVFGMLTDVSSVVAKEVSEKMVHLDDVESAQKWADYLKNEKHCDLVIALTHIGFTDSNSGFCDYVLAQKTRNIDLIVGGHSHTFLDRMYFYKNLDGQSVPVVQNGCWGLNAGEIHVYQN